MEEEMWIYLERIIIKRNYLRRMIKKEELWMIAWIGWSLGILLLGFSIGRMYGG